MDERAVKHRLRIWRGFGVDMGWDGMGVVGRLVGRARASGVVGRSWVAGRRSQVVGRGFDNGEGAERGRERRKDDKEALVTVAELVKGGDGGGEGEERGGEDLTAEV
jgi:hypothetical protein